MTPSEVLDFVKSGPTTIRLVYPEVGWRQNEYPVFGGLADGQRMAFVGAGDPLGLFGVFALKATKVGDLVVIDAKQEPLKQVHLARIKNQAGRVAYDAALDEYDEAEADVQEKLKSLLEGVTEPTISRAYPLDYVRWAKFAKNDIEPRGIIAKSADGTKLSCVPFPGYEHEAARWLAFESIGPDVLERLPEIAGAETFISDPLAVSGADWDDASNIALFDYGAEFYKKTGRSIFK